MHRRESSSSTVRLMKDAKQGMPVGDSVAQKFMPVKAALYIHEDHFSTEQIVVNPTVVEHSAITEGSLVEISPYSESIDVHDFAASEETGEHAEDESVSDFNLEAVYQYKNTKCLCIVKFASEELIEKYPGLEISLTRTLADKFNLRPRTSVYLTLADFAKWRATHVELSFRDAYLARSDMWRLVSREIAGKTVFKGQKISFLSSMKVTVQSIHVQGRLVPTGYFSKTTIPVFRSEAARYVLFIQMSKEMWDFDSEGNGEIMLNKVINGFLPDLFRRWAEIEVRHMVSIILFGRLEYDRFDFDESYSTGGQISQSSSASSVPEGFYQDFYRVVVTDMASAQWTIILNELKRDFQVFLRDMSLYVPTNADGNVYARTKSARIMGRPSTALKGNILEAINMASSQFANDYIDRDLIRTGVSTIIITAGTGVFDVDRDLLNLTSESLANNGIGIDIVCLSRMPLHSVPLFRYRLPHSAAPSRAHSDVSASPHQQSVGNTHPSLPSTAHSPAYSSFTSTSVNYFNRFPSAFPSKFPQQYGYGIPQWIDLSYWAPESENTKLKRYTKQRNRPRWIRNGSKQSFIPRVRMYELQMMGLMELGMADISIPYLSEASTKLQKRRRRIHSDLHQLSSTRSLSQSPSFSRKNKPAMLRYAEDQGLIGTQSKTLGHVLDEMDKYDENIFRNVAKVDSIAKARKQKLKRKDKKRASLSTAAVSVIDSPQQVKESSSSLEKSPIAVSTSQLHSETGESLHESQFPVPSSKRAKPARISRNMSYALRGLAPPMRTLATAEVNTENVKAQPVTAKMSLAQAIVTNSSARPGSARSNDTDKDSRVNHEPDTRSIISTDTAVELHSKPISIGITGKKTADPTKPKRSRLHPQIPPIDGSKEGSSRQASKNNSPSSSDNEDLISEIQSLELMSNSVPRSILPFVRNVNASNPLKKYPQAASAFGKWQHLYPHKPRYATVKWRSLCTPASVPLTTDDFPTAKELLQDYETKQHMVSTKISSDAVDSSISLDNLLQDMISLRLAHGYQVVTGEHVSRTIGTSVCTDEAFLDPSHISDSGACICMVMGNTVQKLDFPDKDQVLVTKYVKKTQYTEYSDTKNYRYTPNVRTILAPAYSPRPMELAGFSEEYPWRSADEYLAAGGIGQDEKVQELRFWRARFVLLPVEPPANSFRAQQHSDDNEEEIHLQGIRALTQMWQRARVFQQTDRRNNQPRSSNLRKKDQNPLEIKYDTLNPSEIVATELDRLLALESLGGEVQSTQLLPDSEKLDRESSMKTIAQAIQGEKGIEIKNRRWHFKLHYNTFHGEELTNWLLHNVKTIETRDEAVEFGNELMKEGLFEHANGRHNFKDGHYFYSMAPDFRILRPDSKASWFTPGRRSDRSIPHTPLPEHPTRDLAPVTTRTRSGSSLAFQLNSSTPLESSKQFLDRRKKTVCLSKMIKIDVDPRKKSARPEIINLHYDRLHNPENCYHVELNWLNVTSKLVDDAIISWTNQAEKYGLKLVEVPIAEASEIPKSEPFRSTYRVKLALEPPRRPAPQTVFTASSFAPQQAPAPDPFVYHKAILKKFNFVLDLEAASEFPENVDIEYSWGKLQYQLTQFVHRSGIGLAQISKEGDLLLLANRLYNSRFTSSKDAAAKFDPKKGSGPSLARPPLQSMHTQPPPLSMPQMAASGIMGINAPSPALSPFSPTVRATADVLGSKPNINSSTIAQYVTPEQIKDEIESFCSDPVKLEQFYKEVVLAPMLPPPSTGPLAVSTNSDSKRKPGNGSTSSSALRPIREPTGGVTDLEVPAFELPESVASPASSGMGIGLGFSMLRRARGSVMYDSVAEMFGAKDRDKDKDRKDQDGTGSSRAGSVVHSPATFSILSSSVAEVRDRKNSAANSHSGSDVAKDA